MDGKSKELLDEFELKEDIYLERAQFLIERGYVFNKEIKTLAYEIFVKEKNNESSRS